MTRFPKTYRVPLWWAVSVAALIALIAGRGTLTPVSIVILAIAGALALCVAAWEHGWLRTRIRAAILLPLIAIGAFLLARLAWPYRPFCYAIFYRSMGPDASVVGGKDVLALVEELSDLPATNVEVTIQELTGHPAEFDPKTVRRDFLPVVYPYFSGIHSSCRFTPTHLVYEPRDLGTEYWVTISVGNGEDTQERIQFTRKGQCISFMRLKDQKVYIKNYLSPFDDFGGCLMSPSEMAKNPKSGAEWTTACQAN